MKLRSMVLAAGALAAVTTTARAEGAPGGKVKAHVTCMTDGGDEGAPAVVKTGKPVKLTAGLWCTIEVDTLGPYKASQLSGVLLTHASPKVSTLTTDPAIRRGPLADTQDGVEFRIEAPLQADQDYKRCEPFEVLASIEEGNGPDTTRWKQPFKVVPACPKPKPIKAALTCSSAAGDGTALAWPGNGVKLKARLEAEVTCSVTTKAKLTGGPFQLSLSVRTPDGATTAPKLTSLSPIEGGQGYSQSSFTVEEYQACANFTVLATVTTGGAQVWKGSQPIKQTCND